MAVLKNLLVIFLLCLSVSAFAQDDSGNDGIPHASSTPGVFTKRNGTTSYINPSAATGTLVLGETSTFVDGVKITGAISGGSAATISSVGVDSNINLTLSAQGAGGIIASQNFSGKGQIQVIPSSGVATSLIWGNNESATYGEIELISASTLGEIGTFNAEPLGLYVGGTQYVNIGTTGLVEIGTSAPAKSELDVFGNVAIGTSYAGATAAPTNGLAVQGYVGVGTTTVNNLVSVGLDIGSSSLPAYTLAIGNTSGTSQMTIGQDNTNRARFLWNYNATVGSAYLALGTRTNAQNLALEDQGGSVVIGTTTAPGSELSVYGNVVIGTSNVGTAAPANGLSVQGLVAIGSTSAHAGATIDMGSTTGAVLLPVGTTGQEPSGVAGMIRYNSTVPQFEGYSGSSWSALGSGGSMVYPGAGIANSTGSAWGTSYTTTGSGTVLALAASPSFTTPNINVATGTSLALTGTVSYNRTVTAETSNYQLLTSDTNADFTNTGASGSVTFTAPASPNIGETHCFYSTVAQTIVVAANTGQTIRNATSVSASAGNFTSNAAIGTNICIEYLVTNGWWVLPGHISGVWTVN